MIVCIQLDRSMQEVLENYGVKYFKIWGVAVNLNFIT